MRNFGMSKEELKRMEKMDEVAKTVNRGKVMTRRTDDGVYIRLAGNVKKGEYFTKDWLKVLTFETEK